ncbi:hypothetical protein H261_11899 [Paramagnetospirillum caucaseum]|uniref:Uncharacterized protein n=1 Tax=Paramagnetospirillum caucaseum TaxID=1244869 RepID=M2Y9N4_9PROT|nr:hypothetical protein H261_11899 [Paramagnetospirillum caucaseum]
MRDRVAVVVTQPRHNLGGDHLPVPIHQGGEFGLGDIGEPRTSRSQIALATGSMLSVAMSPILVVESAQHAPWRGLLPTVHGGAAIRLSPDVGRDLSYRQAEWPERLRVRQMPGAAR